MHIHIQYTLRRPVRKLVKCHFIKTKKNAFEVAQPLNHNATF